GRVQLPGLQLNDRVGQMAEPAGREPAQCGFDSHLGHWVVAVTVEVAEKTDPGAVFSATLTATATPDGVASGLELCLASTATGFNSPRLHWGRDSESGSGRERRR